MVVKPVCSEMEIVDEELAKQGLSYLDCKSATMFYTAGPPPQNATTGSNTAAAASAPAAAPLNNTLGWGAASIATTRAPSAFASVAPQSQLPVSLQDLEARYGEVRFDFCSCSLARFIFCSRATASKADYCIIYILYD